MSDASYDLVFRGECLPDADPLAARAALTAALRLDAAREEQLWSGANVVVRRGADRETAARFQQVFKQAGARLRVVPVEEVAAGATSGLPAAAAPAAPTAAASAAAVIATALANPAEGAPVARKPSLAERLGALGSEAGETAGPVAAKVSATGPKREAAAELGSESAASDSRSFGVTTTPKRPIPDFGLAPLGADVLRPDERAQPTPVAVRIEHIQLAAPGGSIPNLHPRDAIAAAVAAPDLDLAPTGALLGDPTDFVELPLDLSALSLAPVGVVLGTPKEVPAARVSTDHLRLLPQ